MPEKAHAVIGIMSRLLAATLGGYAFTYAFTAALGQWLPGLEPRDAATAATLPAFAVYVCCVLWVFHQQKFFREWLLLPAALPFVLLGWGPVWLAS